MTAIEIVKICIYRSIPRGHNGTINVFHDRSILKEFWFWFGLVRFFTTSKSTAMVMSRRSVHLATLFS